MRDWKPRICRTVKEIHSVLEDFGFFKKKIKCLKAIGMANNLDFYQKLKVRGFSDEDIFSGNIQHYKSTSFAREAKLCEPFFIVFEDDSSLEIMPCKTESALLIGANQIPIDIKDGLNHSNFKSENLFSPLCGTEIESVEITKTMRMRIITDFCKYETAETMYRFKFNLPHTIRDKYGLFDLETEHSFGVYPVRLTIKENLSFSEIVKITLPTEQIPITDGNYGAGFWIYPARYSRAKKDVFTDRNTDEISIDELYMPALVPFLVKYFDKKHPYYKHQIPPELFNGFNWYQWHNLYSYDSIRKMLADINICADMLENDFNNPALRDVKKHIELFILNYFDGRYYPDIPEDEQNEIKRSRINIATDFYRRFTDRMETMLQRSPKYRLITFEGP